jgi:hypothetical protein
VRQVKGLLEAFLRDVASQAEEFERLQPLAPEGPQAAGAAAGYSTRQALAFVARWKGNVSAGRARVRGRLADGSAFPEPFKLIQDSCLVSLFMWTRLSSVLNTSACPLTKKIISAILPTT